MGLIIAGKGQSKQEARARAAEAILNELMPKKSKAAKPIVKKAERQEIKLQVKEKKTKEQATPAKNSQNNAPIQKNEKAKRSTSPKKRPHSHTKRS